MQELLERMAADERAWREARRRERELWIAAAAAEERHPPLPERAAVVAAEADEGKEEP